MIDNSPSKLYPKNVDLNDCDKEPVHIIGKIQDHGFLIAFDSKKHAITRASTNLSVLFNKSIEIILESKITDLLDAVVIEEFILHQLTNTIFYKNLHISNQDLILIAHTSGSEYIFEFEKNTVNLSSFEYHHRLTNIISEINSFADLQQMCDKSVKLIKDYLSYDRVVIYKFDAEGNGQIVSEEKETDQKPWLGLHFPTTDIPKQARALLLKHPIRMNRDIDSEPVLIASKRHLKNNPLDLSCSELRTTSPVHIEYLRNIGAQATLTASIICDNLLWGLISCHHKTPRNINYYQRLTCKFLTQILATQVQLKNSNTSLENLKNNALIQSKLIDQINTKDIKLGLTSIEYNLLSMNGATGAAIYLENEITTIGECPSDTSIKELIHGIKKITPNNYYYTSEFSKDYEHAKAYQEIAAGVMCMFISNIRNSAILWFKPEKLQFVHWAGEPDKIEINQRLTPRKSFEKWSSAEKGKSEPWQDYEVSAAINLQKNLLEIFLEKYEEVKTLNIQLKKAYEDMESFSYSVSHDLRAPLRGIDGFARILKEDYYEQLEDFGKVTIDNIIASSEKMNELIDDILSYSGLGKQQMKFKTFCMYESITFVYESLKNQYPNAIVDIPKNLPAVYADKPTVLLLLKNLMENALKYSTRAKPPVIKIGVKDVHTFYIRDNGIGFDQKHEKIIFNVFVRLVNSEFPGSGIGLAITKRVIEKHGGKIWITSAEGKGTTVYFKLSQDAK